MKRKMENRISYKQHLTTGALVISLALMSSCSSDVAPALTTASTTVAGSAVAKVLSTVSSASPQVKPASVVTTTWQPFMKFKNQLNRFKNALLPSAFAANSSLSAIWGVTGVKPILSSQITLPNDFYAGDDQVDGQGNHSDIGVTSTNQDTFTVTAANATAGAVYTNNGGSFTVANTISGSTTLVANVTSGSAGPNGTLTLSSGTGDATIAFSAVAQNLMFSCTSSSTNCPSPGTLYNTSEALVDFVGQELAPSFTSTNGSTTTIFGRLNSALGIGCAIANLITTDLDTDGLPNVGDHTVAFPTDPTSIVYQPTNSGGCGMDNTQMAGQSTTATFTATGNANYPKLMSINVGNPIKIYLKLDTTNGIFNIMQVEDQRGSGRYAASRTIVNMSGMNSAATTTVAFEYLSTGSMCTAAGTNGYPACGGNSSAFAAGNGWGTGFEFHRGWIDQANDVAYLFSSNGAPGTSYGSPSAVAGGLNKVTYTVTAANATAGAVYTNNSQSFVVTATIAGATTLVTTGTGAPLASGTLTKSSGTGDATITFSAKVINPVGVGARYVYTAAGNPNEISACSNGSCSQKIALSFGFVGENDGAGGKGGGGSVGEITNTTNTTDYNGCVNVGSLAATSNGSNDLTGCSINGTAVSASTATAALDTIRNYYTPDVITTLVNGTTAATVLPFTGASDIYTATTGEQ